MGRPIGRAVMDVKGYPRGIRSLFNDAISEDEEYGDDDDEDEDSSSVASSVVSSLEEPRNHHFDSTSSIETDHSVLDDITLEDSESRCCFASDSSSVSIASMKRHGPKERRMTTTLDALLDSKSQCSFSSDEELELEDGYYKVKEILDYNINRDEYQVLWEGYEEPSWVKDEDLCDSIMTEADVVRFRVLRNHLLRWGSLPVSKKRTAGKSTSMRSSTTTSNSKKAKRAPATTRKSSTTATDSRRLSRGVGDSTTSSRSTPPRGGRSTPRRRVATATSPVGNNCDSSIESQRTRAIKRRALEDQENLRPADGPSRLIASFGGKGIKITIVKKPTFNFFGLWLAERMIPFDIQLSAVRTLPFHIQRTEDENTYPREMEFDDRVYELLSVGFEDDNEAGSLFYGNRPQKATMTYVSASPNRDGTDFSIKEFLLGFGDFTVLDPRKIAARFELFQSPAKFIAPLPSEVFREIEEEGNVGCGFIESNFLEKLCRQGGVDHPEMVSAIQVRIFIPSMGIFKGMLQKKLIPSGRPQIELPPSMKKVPASATADVSSPAYLGVCLAGIHPSHQGINDYIGRIFKGEMNAYRTFERSIEKKPLGDMVLDLWASLGVPDEMLKRYAKESLTTKRHNHAWVGGTADPTGLLPPDYVFVTGMGEKQPDEIFVTRSPCLRHDHGRLVYTVNRHTFKLPDKDWEFLNSLPFGTIIFSRPQPGRMSMPERIACGDLDGDRYLICWDRALLSYMIDADPMPDEPIKDDGILKTVPSNDRWLEEAQKIMFDAKTNNEVGKLFGKLYEMSMEIGKTSKSKKRDPDAMALADAYNEALEFKKHGRPIRLPAHLIADERLRPFQNLLTPLQYREG